MSRSRSVTTAAVLALLTGCLWMAMTGAMVWTWGDEARGISTSLLHKILVEMLVVGFMSVGAVIGSIGIFFQRNWGRILVIILSGPWVLFGWFSVRPLLALPASLRSDVSIEIVTYVFPFAAAIAWLALLVPKKVRTEFLPPPVVQIYVNLLDRDTLSLRQARALDWGNGLFELLPSKDYDSKVEHWEFLPGSFVHCKKADRDGEPYLVAISLESSRNDELHHRGRRTP